MATIVVEALVSASVELLLDKIVSGELVNFFRSTKLDVSLLEKLKITLLSLQAVLNDAEEKQITNHVIKEWLVMLQDAVFDAEDLFDEINTEALRCRVKAENEGKSSKVLSFLSSHFKRSYDTINSRMQILFERLEHFAKEAHLLGLREGVSSSVWHGTPTSSVPVDESSIYGRDSDKEKLREFLLSEDAGECGSKIGVISIVGMGGLGKTTLAKLLYNDLEVKQKFNLKAWTHVSKNFDIVKVTKALLESITSKVIEANNMDTLQVKLQQCLRGEMFLLVLDDIWDVSYVDWNSLKDIFNVGEIGSRIIITTRDERVALTMQTFLPIHKLTPLKSDESWSLLAKHAFGASNYQQRSNFEKIGREIAEKCDGLPLAAIALGGLLRTKLSLDEWNHVLQSNIWELENTEMKPTLQPALLLSYHYLPAPLKRCFAHCAIFPKNFILKKRMVVQIWIAEGLVLQPKSERGWEKVGEEYFDELVSRSLIHQRSVDGEENFEMHDLMNDLATMVSSPYCIRFDEQKPQGSLGRVRHLSYHKDKYGSYNKFDKLYGLEGLHTFLSLPLIEAPWFEYRIHDKEMRDLLAATKHLHVLSLTNYMNITKLPSSIGNSIYLRYLNLSGTNIVRLPSEICNLYNLQTLLLSGCWYLAELPEDMGKLVNLRNLDVSKSNLREMPVQIAKLKNLQTLSDFIVSKQRDGLKVGELGKFPQLQGKLSISELQNVTDPSDAFHSNLKTKKEIYKLVLNWSDTAPSNSNSQIQNLVLEQLQPSINLKSLTIKGYNGTNFPKWLGDSSFGNIVYMKISSCDNCSVLPPLGQLGNLKELFISWMKSIKSVGAEFYGNCSGPSFQPFPSLETLTFDQMPKWEEWNLIGGTTTEFPTLRRLILRGCPKLKGNIPTNLPSLINLWLQECLLLEESEKSDDNSNVIIVRPPSQLMLPSLNSLQQLTLDYFPSLKSLPRDGLPKTLISLNISECENLEFLSKESLYSYTSLEKLHIHHSCYSMTSFTLGSLPVLKNLDISGCKNLRSISLLAEDVSQQQNLSFLRKIIISYCNELESISLCGLEVGLHIPNLKVFSVSHCQKLPSLPKPMNTFIGLQEIDIVSLPNLQSIDQDGLPISLQRLEIGSVGGVLCNTIVWERLTCLTKLEITSADIIKAMMKTEAILLPASLVTLKISYLSDIECLDGKWLHHLTSLQKLHISKAPKLKLLPAEGFPSSLLRLQFKDCPLLEARLRSKRGKEWRKIARIPSIVINDKMII